MNILVAMDAFKGSLSTHELSQAVKAGISRSGIKADVVTTPIADGGEGTCSTLVEAKGGKTISLTVKGPLFETVTAAYGILTDGTAVMEMAAVAGLPLVPAARQNPMNTTTYGLGQMIRDAVARGCRKFIIGIGGSATNDGGMGMLDALGYKFLDSRGRPLVPVGRSLLEITSVDERQVPESLNACRFLVACDVDNPLFGPKGAAHVFGPQKGAGPADVRLLDQGLRQWARVIETHWGRPISTLKGAGAAGGLGAGFSACLNAVLKPGVEIIFDHLGIADMVRAADLVFTGEGRLDSQSVMGKAPSGIARLGARFGKPVIAIAGSVADDAACAHGLGITAMFSITDSPMPLEKAMDKAHARHLVTKTVEQVMRIVAHYLEPPWSGTATPGP